MCFKRRPIQFNQDRIIDIQLEARVIGNISPFPTNFIKTSHYSIIDFLPLSLLLQFKRYANIYFLIIAIIQSIPQISPLTPLSAIAPLVFVLGVSMLREGAEDYARHKSDAKMNSEKTTRITCQDSLIEEKISWADVEVGDVLKIYNDEPFPADLIALDSSYENGVCYIETGALDGEKNMKPKSCLRQTYQIFKDIKQDSIRSIKLNGEKPNQELYKFSGSFEGLFLQEDEVKQDKNTSHNLEFLNNQIKQDKSSPLNINKPDLTKQDSIQKIIEEAEKILNDDYLSKHKQLQVQNQLSEQDSVQNTQKNNGINKSHLSGFSNAIKSPKTDPYTSQKVLVSAKQLLLRGAFLRNTDYVLGMVVYTGLDSKIMRNSEVPKQKTSDMEKTMNTYILGILILQLVCSLFTAILSYFWNSNHLDGHWYLYDKEQINQYGLLGILYFFTYFLLYNTMIPISLIVSLEMVKVAQGYFISNDKQMYSPQSDIWPRVMTTTINEELGQVEYIFSDKTGTLTCNVMEFNKSVIGFNLYGDSGIKNPNKKTEIKDPKKHKLTSFNFYDPHLNDLLSKGENDSNVNLQFKSEDGRASYTIKTQRDLACEYWKLLASAHECIIQKNKETGAFDYQGPSPDEITLVDAARQMGFVFEGASSDTIDLNVRGVHEKLKLLNSFEFNSDRKRMSVIVKDGNVYKLYIKGADSIIKGRLHPTKAQPFLQKTNDYLTQFSLIGLRTLMMAMKILSEDEYQDFKRKMNALASSQNREKDMDNLASEIEQNLILIGATAVEDKLQDKVPETIYDMIKANIKVWMLTGDKLETAENIAKSCKLIQSDFHVIQVSEKKLQDLKNLLLGSAMETFTRLKQEKQKKSLLVEGESLTLIFEDKLLQQAFLKISKDCESVVCCRVTPKQKALVVRLIKDNLKKITLAIGDGANDVNMIQEAHIEQILIITNKQNLGCGIFGNEGMQAAQSSDFAFGEFKCLWRLVLVHGRWSYIRIAEMIVYFFYKNMLFTIPQLYFSFFNAFSGQTIFDAWYISLYNLVFTALPLISRAIFDQDINYKVSVDQVKMGDDDTRLQQIISKKEEYLEKKFPTFYYTSQDRTIFTDGNFLSWMAQGLVHGLIIFFSTYWSFESITFSKEGHSTDLWSFSLTIFTSVILVANLKIAIYTKYWTWISYFSFIFTSLFLYFAFLLGSQVIETSEVFLTPFQMFRNSQFYFIIFLTSGIVLAFDMVVFISKQFLEKQKILGFMRFISNPKVSIERKPSWADEMSIFNSFYSIKNEMKNNNKGSIYRSNSDQKSDLQNPQSRSPQQLLNQSNIQEQYSNAPSPVLQKSVMSGNHTADNTYQIGKYNNQNVYDNRKDSVYEKETHYFSIGSGQNPQIIQSSLSNSNYVNQGQQNPSGNQKYQVQTGAQQSQQKDNFRGLQGSTQQYMQKQELNNLNNTIQFQNTSNQTNQVRNNHLMNSYLEMGQINKQIENSIMLSPKEEVININKKQLQITNSPPQNLYMSGDENVVSHISFSGRSNALGSTINHQTFNNNLQNRTERLDDASSYYDFKNTSKYNKSEHVLMFQDNTPRLINNSVEILKS